LRPDPGRYRPGGGPGYSGVTGHLDEIIDAIKAKRASHLACGPRTTVDGSIIGACRVELDGAFGVVELPMGDQPLRRRRVELPFPLDQAVGSLDVGEVGLDIAPKDAIADVGLGITEGLDARFVVAEGKIVERGRGADDKDGDFAVGNDEVSQDAVRALAAEEVDGEAIGGLEDGGGMAGALHDDGLALKNDFLGIGSRPDQHSKAVLGGINASLNRRKCCLAA